MVNNQVYKVEAYKDTDTNKLIILNESFLSDRYRCPSVAYVPVSYSQSQIMR